MAAREVSHGRGGAGNITPDDTQYADAEIVRAADEGTGVSTGRGGMFGETIYLIIACGCLLCLSARVDPFHMGMSPTLVPSPLSRLIRMAGKKRAGKATFLSLV